MTSSPIVKIMSSYIRLSLLCVTILTSSQVQAAPYVPPTPVLTVSAVSSPSAPLHPGDTATFTAIVHAGAAQNSAAALVTMSVIAPDGVNRTAMVTTPITSIAPNSNGSAKISFTVPANGVEYGSYRVYFNVTNETSKLYTTYSWPVIVAVSPTTVIDLSTAKLTLDDEFVGGLNPAIWSPFFPANQTFGNQSFMPDEYGPLAGTGGLKILAEQKPFNGKAVSSGVITSFGGFSQTYGYFEMKAKMPANGKGLWPAFWLLPLDQSWPPEIDVLEWLGSSPTDAFTTLHFAGGQTGGICKGQDFSAGYHTFGIFWKPGLLAWTVDGVECFSTTTNVPAKPIYIIADMAVGGWEGGTDATTQFPAEMNIAYIKAYQFPDSPAEVLPDYYFGKTVLKNQQGQIIPYATPVKPGDQVIVETEAVIGAADIAKVTANAMIFGYQSHAGYGSSGYVSVGPISAHSRQAIDIPLKIPATLMPGVYDIAIQLAGNNKTKSQWVAQEFKVGN